MEDYYAILGVSREASLADIKAKYKASMKENHPDKYLGMRARYVDEGDDDLIAVIDKQIAEATNICNRLNEAWGTLSDKRKRRKYDEEYEANFPTPPSIVVHPKNLSFGRMTLGESKTMSFRVENKGGPVSSVNVDWEGNEPDWAEIPDDGIKPDPEDVFPIYVTIRVRTAGSSKGTKSGCVVIKVDGAVAATVEVGCQIVNAPKPKTTTVGAKSGVRVVPKKMALTGDFGCSILMVLMIVAAIVVTAIVGNIRGSTNTPQPTPGPTVDPLAKDKLFDVLQFTVYLTGSFNSQDALDSLTGWHNYGLRIDNHSNDPDKYLVVNYDEWSYFGWDATCNIGRSPSYQVDTELYNYTGPWLSTPDGHVGMTRNLGGYVVNGSLRYNVSCPPKVTQSSVQRHTYEGNVVTINEPVGMCLDVFMVDSLDMPSIDYVEDTGLVHFRGYMDFIQYTNKSPRVLICTDPNTGKFRVFDTPPHPLEHS